MNKELIKRIVPSKGDYNDAIELKALFGAGCGVVSGVPAGKDVSEGQIYGVDFLDPSGIMVEDLKEVVAGTRFDGIKVMVEFIPQTRELTL